MCKLSVLLSVFSRFFHLALSVLQVTFADPESARRATANPNPIIDGQRANVNLAVLGMRQPMKGGLAALNNDACFVLLF